jgi:hypothetical protein
MNVKDDAPIEGGPAQTFDVVLYGTITRDIRRMECDAENEADVRAACAKEFPTYRIDSVLPRRLAADGEGLRPDDPSALIKSREAKE